MQCTYKLLFNVSIIFVNSEHEEYNILSTGFGQKQPPEVFFKKKGS